MGVQVNSFAFGSLLTSAKMTALQDTVVHVLSHYTLEHTFNNSTVAGSHTNAVVYNANTQTITGLKTFSKTVHFAGGTEARSYMSLGSGTANAHIKLHSNIAFTEDNYIGYDNVLDDGGLFLITNQLESGVSHSAAEGSWALGVGDGGSTRISFKSGSGQSFKSIFAITTTGVVSAFHVPNAGRAFGGVRKSGNTTLSTSVAWANVLANDDGSIHVENFTLDAGITLTADVDTPIRIFAVGSVTINGVLDANGIAGTNAGGQVAGRDGIIGGSGGAGGDSVSGGAAGGATWQNSGGLPSAGVGTACSTFFRNQSFVYTVTSTDLAGMYGGEGGGGGASGTDNAGTGGAGGGLIYIESPLIQINAGGVLKADGGAGGNGGGTDAGGGGGGGGVIHLRGRVINQSGTLSATGGAGGTGTGAPNGGAGGDGLIIFEKVH